MDESLWRVEQGRGPLVAAAIHHGHGVRDEVARHLALSEADRLREEDPFTGDWTAMAPTRIVALRSRFEVDLNRPREKAVYRTPEDAWGLDVWKGDVPDEVFERSLSEYDAFYSTMHDLLTKIEGESGRFVVFDLHSYNHRREGPDAPAADPTGNPQVNLGTGSMDRIRWGPVVDRFIRDLGAYDFPGGRLDVRENIKFRGGHFPSWVHRGFPMTGCAWRSSSRNSSWTNGRESPTVHCSGPSAKRSAP